MSFIKYIFAVVVTFSSFSHAEEKTSEALTEVIEVEHFIVNWAPSTEGLGRAIIYRCTNCTPTTMTFDDSTELFINNQPRPIFELSKKVDWSGFITTTTDAPTKITKIRTH
jgi:hypothetical protein